MAANEKKKQYYLSHAIPTHEFMNVNAQNPQMQLSLLNSETIIYLISADKTTALGFT